MDGLSLAFLVTKPLPGTYTLTVGGSYADAQTYVEGTFEFDVPELPNFAE